VRQISALDELQLARDRDVAALHRIGVVLDSAATRVMRLCQLRSQLDTQLPEDFEEELERLGGELAGSELALSAVNQA
jgi:hypothetical protein